MPPAGAGTRPSSSCMAGLSIARSGPRSRRSSPPRVPRARTGPAKLRRESTHGGGASIRGGVCGRVRRFSGGLPPRGGGHRGPQLRRLRSPRPRRTSAGSRRESRARLLPCDLGHGGGSHRPARDDQEDPRAGDEGPASGSHREAPRTLGPGRTSRAHASAHRARPARRDDRRPRRDGDPARSDLPDPGIPRSRARPPWRCGCPHPRLGGRGRAKLDARRPSDPPRRRAPAHVGGPQGLPGRDPRGGDRLPPGRSEVSARPGNRREKTKPGEAPWNGVMRVAILGVGGLGRTLASELRADPRVPSLLLIDQLGERARVLTGLRGRVPIEAAQLNVENRLALAKAIRGCDVVVNTTLPKYNLTIMQAALEAGGNYLDVAATGPRQPRGPPWIFQQNP